MTSLATGPHPAERPGLGDQRGFQGKGSTHGHNRDPQGPEEAAEGEVPSLVQSCVHLGSTWRPLLS